MMNLNDLESEWKADCKIDITNLTDISADVPRLHSKYIGLLSHCKKEILQAEKSYIKKRRIRAAYYNGELGKQELDDNNWQQYQGKKPLKTALDELLQSDEYLIDSKMQIEELSICKDYLESVMKSIHSRGYDVKNVITYLQWSNGMG